MGGTKYFGRDHAFPKQVSKFEDAPRALLWDKMAASHDGNNACIDRRIAIFRRIIGIPSATTVDATVRTFPFYIVEDKVIRSMTFRVSATVANAKIRFGIHSSMNDRLFSAGGNLVYNIFPDKLLTQTDEVDAATLGVVTVQFRSPITLAGMTPYFFTMVGNNASTPSIVHHPNTGCDPVWAAESLASAIPAANTQTPKCYTSTGSIGSATEMGNTEGYPATGWNSSRSATIQYPYITLNY